MANRFWVNDDADNDANVAANWSATSGGSGGAGVPTGSDDVVLDSAVNDNCTLTANFACLSLSINLTGGYTGQFDAVTFDLAIGTGTVDFTTSQANKILMGSGTWTCDGNWISSPMGGSAFLQETADLVMTGTSKNLTLNSNEGRNARNATIAAGATITTTGGGLIQPLTVANGGALTINTGSLTTGGNSTVGTSCTVDGTGTWVIKNGANITSLGSAVAVDVTFQRANDIAAGTYSGAVQFSGAGASNTMTFLGDVVFTGAVTVGQSNNVLTFANSVNNPDITIQGAFDLTPVGGSVTWTKGTGTITISGSSSQNIDFNGETIEDLTINKSAGDLVMMGGFITDVFTGTSTGSGDFDPNGQDIESVGDCSWAAAFLFDTASAATMNACTFTVGGNFTADGQTLNATATWALEVTGTAVASGVGAVAYSNATGFTEITATGWTDNGNNTNWNLGAAPSGNPWYSYYQEQLAA